MRIKFTLQNSTKCAFTLIEMMLALGISSMIAASVIGVMINVFWIYQDTSADFYLTQFGRITREKLLRGDDGKFGMREAYWSSFSASDSSVTYSTDNDTEDPYASNDTTDSVLDITGHLPASFGGSLPKDMIMAELSIEDEKVETSNAPTFKKVYQEQRGVNIYTLLKLVISGKTYLAEQKIGATIIND